MNNIEIAGVRVDVLDRNSFLGQLRQLNNSGQSGYVVTPYSGFVVDAQHDLEFRQVLINADISIADGVGVIWAAHYLSLTGNKLHRWLVSWWRLLFSRQKLYDPLPVKLSGSEVIYDLCTWASRDGLSVFFLGGFDFGQGNTGELAAEKLKSLNPGLKVAGCYSGSPSSAESDAIVAEINNAKPDLLFVAYGPIRQEKWIAKHLSRFEHPVIAFGLGGTFDYVSGAKSKPPQWVVKMGLEGILRAFISEGASPRRILKRWRRSWSSVFGFIWVVWRTS